MSLDDIRHGVPSSQLNRIRGSRHVLNHSRAPVLAHAIIAVSVERRRPVASSHIDEWPPRQARQIAAL